MTVDVAAHPDPMSLLADPDPVLAANKRLVFDMWRSIVNAGHFELADTMLEPAYIQHSPVLPTGRDAFKRIFSAVERTAIPPVVSPPLVAILAEGDLVVMALREDMPVAGGKGCYTTTHFNMFRVRRGRLAEHWHSVQTPPGESVPPPEQGGPQPITGASGAAGHAKLQAGDPQLAANKRLVFEAWQAAPGSRPDWEAAYLGEPFVEHDPSCDGPQDALAAAGEAPLVAMVAQHELVVMVTCREQPHPVRAGATYTTAAFDMFRIAENRLAEHWSGALKPGEPLPRYGQ